MTLQVTNGFNGHTKCTWLVQTETGFFGPAFKLTKADYGNVLLQWVEWVDKTNSLTGNAILPTTDGANYYIGAYADVTGGVYFNPMTSNVAD